MENKPINRKAFLSTLGKAGACGCLCAAAAGMRAALAGQTASPTSADDSALKKAVDASKPGDKTLARAAKRMEFGDGWLGRFFAVMDQTIDEPARRKLMMANGKACFIAYAGPPKRKPEPDAFEKFKKFIVEKGKERGYSLEGNVIYSEYTSSAETGQASPEQICLCPMAETQTPGKLSPTFCLCSLGYVKEMHERVLGRPVEVELVDSVLRGGKRCKFKMTVV